MFVALLTALTLVLPVPTGSPEIGTVSLHLVDRSRADPWVSGTYRELMVSVWYPARGGSGRPVPQMTPQAAEDFGRTLAPALFGTQPGEVDWAATRTHARAAAPVRPGRYPVILFSPGFGAPRSVGTATVEDLAGRGYIVVAVDHTYEAAQVAFPGGRLARAQVPPTPEGMLKALRVRVADSRFVLDQLALLARGQNPDAGRRPLPSGLRRALDLGRTGALGHSMGGSTAAELVHDDPRIDAGVNLDGGHRGQVADTGVAKPFLQLAAGSHTRESDPSWRDFWAASTGWKRELRLTGAEHYSFTDAQPLAPQLPGLPEPRRRALIGEIDPKRSLAVQRAYLAAFFDLQLKGRATSLFDGPSAAYPEAVLIP